MSQVILKDEILGILLWSKFDTWISGLTLLSCMSVHCTICSRGISLIILSQHVSSCFHCVKYYVVSLIINSGAEWDRYEMIFSIDPTRRSNIVSHHDLWVDKIIGMQGSHSLPFRTPTDTVAEHWRYTFWSDRATTWRQRKAWWAYSFYP